MRNQQKIQQRVKSATEKQCGKLSMLFGDKNQFLDLILIFPT